MLAELPDATQVKEAIAAGGNAEVIELLVPILSTTSVHDILPTICRSAETAAECDDLEYAEAMFQLAIHLYANCFVADHACGLKAIEALESLLRRQGRDLDLKLLHRGTRHLALRARKHLESTGEKCLRHDGPVDYIRFCRGA